MRTGRIISLFLAAWLFLTAAAPLQAATATAGPAGRVQAVLFWMQGCPHCEIVIQETLPELQSRYGEALEVQLVEIVGLEDVDRLYRIGAAYGLAKEDTGVPLLVVGEVALSGSERIPAELPALIERYLAAGGVQTQVRESAAEPAPNQDDGLWLGWLTMALMILGLALALLIIGRGLQGASTPALPAWTVWLTPLLSAAGMVVAIYLTFIETTKAQAICGPVGDCNAVQNSPYALLFGVLPVGLLGLLGYLAILGIWAWQRVDRQALFGMTPAALFGMALFGVIYSIYLTYLELFVIHAVCIWCISSAWFMTLLMLLFSPQAADWLNPAEESEA